MPAGSTAHAQAPGNAPHTEPPLPSVARRRRTFAVLIAILWCAALGALVLTCANPVTLNRRQILDAAAVVTVHVVDPQAGTCRVNRQWTGAPLPQQITVDQLSETAARADGEWILPLAKHGDRLEVLPSLLPSAARLVYPATPAALRQLEAILAQQQRR